MSSLAIKNIGTLVSGDMVRGILDADSILCQDGIITRISHGLDVSGAEVVVDARGTTVIPGLIDSHCHVVLGDYTPRQKTVGFLESYVHGGITSAISPGEIHAPGRPGDAAGVKALAVAAHACFAQSGDIITGAAACVGSAATPKAATSAMFAILLIVSSHRRQTPNAAS